MVGGSPSKTERAWFLDWNEFTDLRKQSRGVPRGKALLVEGRSPRRGGRERSERWKGESEAFSLQRAAAGNERADESQTRASPKVNRDRPPSRKWRGNIFFLRARAPDASGYGDGASATASRTASMKLCGFARFFPAISKAVPWSGEVRAKGSPRLTFTPLSKAASLNGIRPWS